MKQVQNQRGQLYTRGYVTFDRISISPFPITNLFDSVVDPDPLSTSSVWDLDPFTQMLWKHHEDAVKRCNLKTLFGTKSLCPDSYYTHVVKEISQSGHLERSGLQERDPAMYNSIKLKVKRNARFFLFEMEPVTGTQITSSTFVPMLHLVRREAVQEPRPTLEQCMRIIPIGQVRALLEKLHKDMNCRMMGIEKEVAEAYVGVPRDMMREYQQKYCKTCTEHQPRDHRLDHVTPIVSHWPRQRYVIDLIEMPEETVEGHGTFKYILTCVDHFSRKRWTQALQRKLASVVVLQLTTWWSEYGRPDILQSDNGMEFCAEEMKALCRQWGVRKRHSRPYKPSTNGSVERANRDIKQRLSRYRCEHPDQGWYQSLPQVTMAFNTCWSRVHNTSPDDVWTPPPRSHRQPPDQSVLPVQDWSDGETDSESVQEIEQADAKAANSSVQLSAGDDESDSDGEFREVVQGRVRRSVSPADDDHPMDGTEVDELTLPLSLSPSPARSVSMSDGVGDPKEEKEEAQPVVAAPVNSRASLNFASLPAAGGLRRPPGKQIVPSFFGPRAAPDRLLRKDTH